MQHNVVDLSQSLFDIGIPTMTVGVAARLNATAVAHLIRRHARGDFGECGTFDEIDCPEDVLEQGPLATGGSGPLNKAAILQDQGYGRNKWQGRILSVYHVTADDGEPLRVWVITEADRSSTTALLPSEY